VLFLVDRNTLAKQTEDAFAEHLPALATYRVPRTGEKFLAHKQVTICTLQTMINEYRHYSAGYFDLVVTFSVFEHLHEYPRALTEIYRVLNSGGLFLLGMPSVNKLMEAGFHAIGFGDINDHHVTTPAQVERACPLAGFTRVRQSFLDFPPRSPLHVRLYHTWLFEKPLGRLTPAP
jgi:SAM-dependent methyltransferase